MAAPPKNAQIPGLSNLTFCCYTLVTPSPSPSNGETSRGTPVTPVPPVTCPARARLAITKAAPQRVMSGQRFVYTTRVRNRSRVIARNVLLTDPLPQGVLYVRASRAAQVRGRTVSVRLGNLRPGQVRTVRVTVRSAAVCGSRVNIASAQAANAPRIRARAATALVCQRRVIVPAVTG